MQRRQPLKRRSKKRPAWENVELRQHYLFGNPACELWDILEGEAWERIKRQPVPGGVCVHHICRMRMRHDVWANFLTVSANAHLYVHQYPVEGMLVAFWAKQRKREFNRDVLREIWGQDPVAWVERQLETAELEPWAFDLGKLLIEGV